MKSNSNFFLISLVLGSVILAFITTLLFTRPALSSIFDLSNKGQIGDVIGGIATPLFTLISFILIYYSFKEQYKANQIQIQTLNEQRIEKELSEEYILLENLLENTDKKIDLFEVTEKRDAIESFIHRPMSTPREKLYVSFRGATAIIKLCDSLMFTSEHSYSNEIFNLQKIEFFPEFLYILKHAEYLQSKIVDSKLDSYRKRILFDRFSLLYNTKISLPINLLVNNYQSFNISNDILDEVRSLKINLDRKYNDILL
jgi:hypothetical protein